MPSTYSFSSRLLMQSLRLRYRYCYKGNFRAHFVWNMYGVQHQHVPKSPKAQNNPFQNIQKHYFLFLGVTFNGGMSFAVPCCSFLCRIRLQKVRGGKFVMERRPVYHHCSHLLPTVLHTTQTLTQNQITLPDVAQDISSNAWGYFPPRQMLLQAGWVVGWGGWKPLLQMDLELVRQQISSQAKRGKPTNNLIFFLLQKRWELSGWKYESNSVLDLACKLWQTSYILSLSNTFPYFILINWGILNLSGNSSDL